MVVLAARNAIVKTTTPDGITVGSDSTTVLAANGNRTNAKFINDSDEVMYLAEGSTAYMNKGIRLNPSGGSYTIVLDNLYRGIVTGICASGSKNLCISEGE